jgi:hypothetical protein
LEALREGAAYAERRGIEELGLALATNITGPLADLGAWKEVMTVAGDLVPRLEEAGDVLGLVNLRLNQATVLTRSGDLPAASPLAEWGEWRAREIAEAGPIAMTLPTAALVRLGKGDRTGALSLLFELDRTPNVREDPNYCANLPDAVRTALAAGDPELAVRLAEGVKPVYPFHEHVLTTVRALLAEHRGEHAEATDAFADAAERWERFEMPWERAQALLGQGRCLLALGRAVDATGPLRDAREIFASLGAKPALAETDVLLERAVARTS